MGLENDGENEILIKVFCMKLSGGRTVRSSGADALISREGYLRIIFINNEGL